MNKLNPSVEFVKCQECGYCFRGYIPKGSDGSVLFVRTHKTMDYSGYRFKRVKCPGSNKQGEIVHD
jgi:hypothetical protein